MSHISNIIIDKLKHICHTRLMHLLPAQLQTLGLTQNELDLYQLLLELGEAPIAEVFEQAKLKRPTVYKSLYSLEKVGLVTKRDFQKKIHFKPEPPTKLLEIADSHYKSLERMRNDLQSIIPQLTSSYILSVERPIVRTYEGIEGLKEVYKDILHDQKPGYSVLQTENMEPELEKWLVTTFLRGRLKNKMHLKAIVMDGPEAKTFTKNDTKEFRISRIVPPNLFPFQHEVTIYGDKVAFMHYKKDEPLISMVIKHPNFAQTMKAWFDLAWEGAEHYKKTN